MIKYSLFKGSCTLSIAVKEVHPYLKAMRRRRWSFGDFYSMIHDFHISLSSYVCLDQSCISIDVADGTDTDANTRDIRKSNLDKFEKVVHETLFEFTVCGGPLADIPLSFASRNDHERMIISQSDDAFEIINFKHICIAVEDRGNYCLLRIEHQSHKLSNAVRYGSIEIDRYDFRVQNQPAVHGDQIYLRGSNSRMDNTVLLLNKTRDEIYAMFEELDYIVEHSKCSGKIQADINIEHLEPIPIMCVDTTPTSANEIDLIEVFQEKYTNKQQALKF